MKRIDYYFMICNFCITGIFLSGITAIAQKDYTRETKMEKDSRMGWWHDARFGMFIHWGAYSVPAGTYQGKTIYGPSEWIMDAAKIPVKEYEKFPLQFNPEKFDANEWVKIAKDAGMKYIVITSKHHDGFCMWGTKMGNYNIMDFSPYKKDVLDSLASACREQGIKLCFYYSIMDWHNPDAKGENFARYREEYLKPQLKELLTNYGDIGVLWFDGDWINEWTEDQGKDLYNYLRNIKPDLIINNRVGKGRNGMQGMTAGESVGDFGTPEQEILPGTSDMAWESCMTMNDSWGFKTSDNNWKSSQMLIHNLIDIVSKGGNYLLNVGPTSEGLIPEQSCERLGEMGAWLKINGEAIYWSKSLKNYKEDDSIRYTSSREGRTIYAMLMKWPGRTLALKNVKPNPSTLVFMLGYAQPLQWKYSATEGLLVDIPESLQSANTRPCKYAWTLKIKGSMTDVLDAPVIRTVKDENSDQCLFSGQVEVNLNDSTTDASIHYTIDGTMPTLDSPLYSKPLMFSQNILLKAATFKPNIVSSPVRECHFVKVIPVQSITLLPKASPKYPGQGDKTLIDLIRAGDQHTDVNWLGFEGEDLVATLDLGSELSVKAITIGFLQNINSWIFFPESIEFSASADGEHFTILQRIANTIDASQTTKEIRDFSCETPGTAARYIRIKAKNIGICPPWHPGAGGKAWLFADEIIIK